MPMPQSNDRLTSRTIIAAKDGWSIVYYWEGKLTEPTAIIAWAIEHWEGEWADDHVLEDYDPPLRNYYLVIPITTDGGLNLTRQMFAIKEPNGWYTLPNDCGFKRKADLIVYLNDLERMEAERKHKPAT